MGGDYGDDWSGCQADMRKRCKGVSGDGYAWRVELSQELSGGVCSCCVATRRSLNAVSRSSQGHFPLCMQNSEAMISISSGQNLSFVNDIVSIDQDGAIASLPVRPSPSFTLSLPCNAKVVIVDSLECCS